MKTAAKTFDELFREAGDRERDLRELDKIIKKAAPKLKPVVFEGMHSKVFGYGVFYYKYASGREGKWPLISIANQKNYISLYVCAVKGGKYLPETYASKLGRTSIGKSCIRFKKLDGLEKTELAKLIKEAAELQSSGQNAFSNA